MFRPALITLAVLMLSGTSTFAQDEIIKLEPETVIEPAKPVIDHVYTEAPDDHAIGAEDAPVTMIIYASVTCPHCSDWFKTQWPDFKTQNVETGKVRAIFREFPTAPVQLAMAGFLIANCAGEDLFFSSIEHQMEIQDDIFKRVEAGQAQQAYLDVAKHVGIEGEDGLQACFTQTKHEDRLNRALSRAQAANARSVPAFYINGENYKDDLSTAGLSTKVDSLINASP